MDPTLQDLFTQLDAVNSQLETKYTDKQNINVDIIHLERQALDLKQQIKDKMAQDYNMK